MTKPILYKRILLKLSGEALMGQQGFGIDPKICIKLAKDLQSIQSLGIQIGLVIGAGNIFRGLNGEAFNMKRVVADQIGMIATTINGLSIQQCLENLSCKAHVMTALSPHDSVKAYNYQEAQSLLQKNEIVIFVGGSGNPYFTTDSAAALRAAEMTSQVLIKATKVDGIYDRDPVKYPQAVKYDSITYTQAIQEELAVMDITAMTLCKENNIPIRVIKIESIIEAMYEEQLGTLVKERI